ncbi:hypothetical protein [Nocardia fusca]|uniref:hypothetical protein n=1 Tax=Nocardia fusca TaxID=941183 RepID=UPI0012F4C938|nr:hypothetical protein [Nocardia fusca]
MTEFGATTDQRRLTHSAAEAITLWPILIANDEPLKHPLTFTATDQNSAPTTYASRKTRENPWAQAHLGRPGYG